MLSHQANANATFGFQYFCVCWLLVWWLQRHELKSRTAQQSGDWQEKPPKQLISQQLLSSVFAKHESHVNAVCALCRVMQEPLTVTLLKVVPPPVGIIVAFW